MNYKPDESFTFYQCWKETIESTQHLICWRYQYNEIPTCEAQRNVDRIRGQVSLPLFRLNVYDYDCDTEKETKLLRLAFGINKGRVNVIS